METIQTLKANWQRFAERNTGYFKKYSLETVKALTQIENGQAANFLAWKCRIRFQIARKDEIENRFKDPYAMDIDAFTETEELIEMLGEAIFDLHDQMVAKDLMKPVDHQTLWNEMCVGTN